MQATRNHVSLGTPSLRNLFRKQSGAASVEYAVVLALIVVACLSSIAMLGQNTNSALNGVIEAIDESVNESDEGMFLPSELEPTISSNGKSNN